MYYWRNFTKSCTFGNPQDIHILWISAWHTAHIKAIITAHNSTKCLLSPPTQTRRTSVQPSESMLQQCSARLRGGLWVVSCFHTGHHYIMWPHWTMGLLTLLADCFPGTRRVSPGSVNTPGRHGDGQLVTTLTVSTYISQYYIYIHSRIMPWQTKLRDDHQLRAVM